MTMTSRIDVQPACGRRDAVFFFFLSFPWARTMRDRISKNNGNPDLVCEKYHNHTLDTNQRHREEALENTNSNKATERQLKQSNQLSFNYSDTVSL